jgi:hypothetical protein
VETVVTNGEGVDHASAISLLGPDGLDARARLLVVYDSPAADRRPWPETVLADRVRIGPDDEVDDGLDDIDGADDLAAVDLADVETGPASEAHPPDDDADDDPAEPPADEAPGAPTDPVADAEPAEPAPVDDRPATVPFPSGMRQFAPEVP